LGSDWQEEVRDVDTGGIGLIKWVKFSSASGPKTATASSLPLDEPKKDEDGAPTIAKLYTGSDEAI
jgi:hypothetical protein